MLRMMVAGALAAGYMTAGTASATTVTFDELAHSDYVQFTNPVISGGLQFLNSVDYLNSLVIWGSAGDAAQYNADPGGATLTNNAAASVTTVTKVGGGTFDFYSIDLTSPFNNGTGGDVLFDFGSFTQIVTLQGAPGLQQFVFDLSGLTSFSITGLTTEGQSVQFDNVVYDSTGAVPEPATWAMMIGGIGLIGAAARRRRVKVQFAF